MSIHEVLQEPVSTEELSDYICANGLRGLNDWSNKLAARRMLEAVIERMAFLIEDAYANIGERNPGHKYYFEGRVSGMNIVQGELKKELKLAKIHANDNGDQQANSH